MTKNQKRILTRAEIDSLPKYHRINLINTLSGPRSANLIGTTNEEQQTNLAIFNSVTHIGANPAYLGMIMRPLTVERHTYSNIKKTGQYTVNPVNEAMCKQAHQTSGKYPTDVSEFEAVGLTQGYMEGFGAPYVAESKYAIGLTYEEEHKINCNDTVLVIGRVEWVLLPQHGLSDDLSIDYQTLSSLSVGGLDTYYKTKKLERLPYVKL